MSRDKNRLICIPILDEAFTLHLKLSMYRRLRFKELNGSSRLRYLREERSKLRATGSRAHTMTTCARVHAAYTRALASSGSIIFDTRVRDIQNTRSRRMQRSYVAPATATMTVAAVAARRRGRQTRRKKSAWKMSPRGSRAASEMMPSSFTREAESSVLAPARGRARAAQRSRVE